MRDWYRLNEARESWLFLILDADKQSQLNAWAFGAGNVSHLVRTAEESAQNTHTETGLLNSLRRSFRVDQDDNPLLITPCADTIPLLRRQLLASQDETQFSLRGFRHVAVNEVLETHLGGSIPNNQAEHMFPVQRSTTSPAWTADRKNIEVLWELWTSLIFSIPLDALAGGPV